MRCNSFETRGRGLFGTIFRLQLVGLFVLSPLASAGSYELTEDRRDLEDQIADLAHAYASSPGDASMRRAYSLALFKLGNVWQANDVIAPLATVDSENEDDLLLGGTTALMTMDLDRAEGLFDRLMNVATKGTDAYDEAVSGMLMVHYQKQNFEKTRALKPTGEEPEGSAFFPFLQAFEGAPYQLEWSDSERVARLPFTNDIKPPGALPEVHIRVNGKELLLTLDTGGDRLYLDVSAAEKVGIRELVVGKAKYAYTKGEYVDEPLGVADIVELGGATLRNVPAVVAQWKANGLTTDGVLGTAVLKQFLSTIDYEKAEITLRPRGVEGRAAFRDAIGERELVRMPFFLSSTHLMFAKGQINGHEGLNLFLDSGLAASMPIILVNETTELLDLERNDIEGTPYYWSPVTDHGLDGFPAGPAQGLGNVFVESDNYRSQGFFWDALISHQYLWKLGFWVIDFDTMSYYFPASSEIAGSVGNGVTTAEAEKETAEVANPDAYVGDYAVGGGALILKISQQDGTLFLQAPGQQSIAMEAYADGTFGIPLAGATITFQGTPDSGITGLELSQAGAVTKAAKQ